MEIVKLCEQNQSSFEGSCEVAIRFHRNEIFHYIYENKIEKGKHNDLGKECIFSSNYELLSVLEGKGIRINESMINEAARIGNLFLIKYFLENNQIPTDILFFSAASENTEFFKFIIEQKGIDVNAKDEVYFNNLLFQNNIWNFFKLFGTALIWASENGHAEIVKILVGQEGIDINAKDNVFFQ